MLASGGLVAGALLSGCATTGNPDSPVAAVVVGPPVPPPANLDPRYLPEALKTAFAAGCKASGLRILDIAVDESAFPYLLYGVVETGGSFETLKAAVARMEGYRYMGSTTSRRDGLMFFVLDITPRDQYPARSADPAATRAEDSAHRMAILNQLDPKVEIRGPGRAGN